MGYRELLIEELRKIIPPFLKENAVDLIELKLITASGSQILRLLVDKKEGGITLQECARLNQRLGIVLDAQDIIKNNYVLEVSSPGLDMPLNTKNDFLRCLNKKARFLLKEPINGKLELEGKIIEAEDDLVYIDIAGETVKIPIVKINKAKQIF